MISVKTTLHSGHEEEVEIDHFPDSCPVCHYGVEPRYQGLAHFKKPRDIRLELIFQCPRQNCQSFFIARYFYSAFQSLYLQGCFPFTPVQKTHSEHIHKVSPSFCVIENQAFNAERQGWNLVAGPGYRKALEFLIKDYLCGLRPADAEAIKHIQLGPCIKSYVTNENIKACAERAAWIGNDETHYVRKWEDKDLSDLKTLIGLTVNWIEMEEMTKKALGDMPSAKK